MDLTLTLQGIPSGRRLGLVDLDFDRVPLSAQLCLGLWEFGRSGLAAGHNGGTAKSKSTKPSYPTTWATLY